MKDAIRHAGLFTFKNEIMMAYAVHPQHEEFVQQFWIIFVSDFMEIDTQIML